MVFGTTKALSGLFCRRFVWLRHAGMSPLRTFAISALGSQSFGMATGALRFVELPFAMSPLAAYIYDTGNYQMAFLILVGLIAVACIGPLFIVSGGAKSRRARIQAAHKSELALKEFSASPCR